MSDQTTNSNRQRYRILLETARASGQLWIAESPDRILILPNENKEVLIPVWPSEEAVRRALSTRANLSEFQPVSESLERWLEVTPGLVEDGILVAAYPDENLSCLRVPADSFARDLAPSLVLQGSDIARLKRKVKNRRQARRKT